MAAKPVYIATTHKFNDLFIGGYHVDVLHGMWQMGLTGMLFAVMLAVDVDVAKELQQH